jgi:hypothetical protein
MFPCRQNGYWLTYKCDFEVVGPTGPGEPPTPTAVPVAGVYPKSATCPVSRKLDSLTLLTYRASAVDGSGQSASTNYITYSGGAPPPETTLPAVVTSAQGGPTQSRAAGEPPPPPPPPPVEPSAGDVLRPIWLESDIAPFEQPPRIYWDTARRVDVAFLPDADWGEYYSGFSYVTGEIARNLLFEPLNSYPVPNIMADYFFWKQQFSYWVGPIGADAEYCSLTTTGWVWAALAVTDGQAIVHRNPFAGPECSLGQGWGTVYANAYNPFIIYAHESGHFLFCMGDEYPGADPVACSHPANTFLTLEACQQTATTYKFPITLCKKIDNSNLWRITNGSPEIMARTVDDAQADWQFVNHILFQLRMASCLLGACN